MEGTIFVFWNWMIAVYLFVAGISAGAFAVSALAYFLGEEKYRISPGSGRTLPLSRFSWESSSSSLIWNGPPFSGS